MEIPKDQVLCVPGSEKRYECCKCLIRPATRICDEHIKPKQNQHAGDEQVQEDKHRINTNSDVLNSKTKGSVEAKFEIEADGVYVGNMIAEVATMNKIDLRR